MTASCSTALLDRLLRSDCTGWSASRCSIVRSDGAGNDSARPRCRNGPHRATARLKAPSVLQAALQPRPARLRSGCSAATARSSASTFPFRPHRLSSPGPSWSSRSSPVDPRSSTPARPTRTVLEPRSRWCATWCDPRRGRAHAASASRCCRPSRRARCGGYGELIREVTEQETEMRGRSASRLRSEAAHPADHPRGDPARRLRRPRRAAPRRGRATTSASGSAWSPRSPPCAKLVPAAPGPASASCRPRRVHLRGDRPAPQGGRSGRGGPRRALAAAAGAPRRRHSDERRRAARRARHRRWCRPTRRPRQGSPGRWSGCYAAGGTQSIEAGEDYLDATVAGPTSPAADRPGPDRRLRLPGSFVMAAIAALTARTTSLTGLSGPSADRGKGRQLAASRRCAASAPPRPRCGSSCASSSSTPSSAPRTRSRRGQGPQHHRLGTRVRLDRPLR